jgi:hypothetical protein
MKRVPVSRDGMVPSETSINIGDAIEFVLASGLSIPTVVAESTYSCDGCVFLNDDNWCPEIAKFHSLCEDEDCVFLPVEQLI